ncbi:hypothetical protein FOH10_01150 [Nocardia otitidiscaviarum]|uniref:Uncharacterized protein n=1 Tax=Nocardia otitidiscaviarum TaxID=1823 RepID=A0A516NF76_9NOCA|nr:DUF6350 family protein [Nocardia otitidiscaviarum]MCP9622865.1 DUF6350 family protein [Nocardia otitidiscaviarum]QDP77558.1 hypothetical protein FOH10_01150 [Nocardia otitidiscaviarum]
MSAAKAALARLSDIEPPEPGSGGPGGGFGSLTPERARVLLVVAARASSIALLVIVALVSGALLAAGSGLEGTGGAIAASWLAVHQVPLVIGKTSLGLLPLLPTGLMLWIAARDCAHAVPDESNRADLGWIVGAALGGPLLITAVCLAVADDAAAVVSLQPPNTSAAFGWVFGLHLLAAAAGIGSRRWRELLALSPAPVPHWVVPGVRAGVRAVWRLLLVAAAVTLVSFLAHWSAIGETYRAAGDIAGVLGLTLLSVAYLPNVLIDAVAVLVGGQVHIGAGSLSLFEVTGAPIPAVPIAAAVPTGPAAGWWVVLLLAPAAVGVLGGLDIGRTTDDRPTAPWATLTSAAVAAVLLTLLGSLAGGVLGSFGQIGPNLLLLAIPAFLWLALPGYVGMVAARWFVVPAADPGYAADDDYAADDYADGEYADYDDEYDSDGRYDSDGEYDSDDEYDSDSRYDSDDYEDADYYDEYDEYEDAPDGTERVVEVDGELVDEPPALTAEPHADDPADADIVDAEVVEADLLDTGEVDGR